MKQQKFLLLSSNGFILLSAFSLLSVSLMAFHNPQSVMDLVAVQLTNTDAYSSIRGVYGGVGLTIFIVLLYSMRSYRPQGLGFLTLFWGFYAFSRVYTNFKEGTLGAFGQQWLLIETVFFIAALVLFILNKRQANR